MMTENMILAAAETADIFTLGNDVFTEILTVVFMGALIVGAVFLGAKLRIRHDAKAAAGKALLEEGKTGDGANQPE